jgi:hypothetical protein
MLLVSATVFLMFPVEMPLSGSGLDGNIGVDTQRDSTVFDKESAGTLWYLLILHAVKSGFMGAGSQVRNHHGANNAFWVGRQMNICKCHLTP